MLVVLLKVAFMCVWKDISRKEFARCFWGDFVAVYITMEEWLKEHNLSYVSLFIEMLNQQNYYSHGMDIFIEISLIYLLSKVLVINSDLNYVHQT